VPVIRAVRSAGLNPTVVTFYSLRHSAVVRAILAGVPLRVIAAQVDSSVPMLEKAYSFHPRSLRRGGAARVARPVIPRALRQAEDCQYCRQGAKLASCVRGALDPVALTPPGRTSSTTA